MKKNCNKIRMILIQGHIASVSPSVLREASCGVKNVKDATGKKHVVYKIRFLIVALFCWVFCLFICLFFVLVFVFVCFVCFIVFCFCFFSHLTQFSPDLSKFFNLCLCCMLAGRTHGLKSKSLNKEPSLFTQFMVLEKTKVRPGYRERK